MQLLIFSLFTAAFSLDYLALTYVISGKATLLADLLSLFATFAFVGYISRNRSIALNVKYLIFFAIVGAHIVNGIVINLTPSGAVVAGVKLYVKYLPFLLLPLVYRFSERQISAQLRFLLFLCLMQLPLALLQRFVLHSVTFASGDVVTGSMTTSSFLSIVLICSIAMLTAFYQKHFISVRMFMVLLFLLFIPTAINETKGTLILLPIALFVPLLFGNRDRQQRNRQALALIVAAGIMGGGYVTAYNALYGQRYAAEEGGEGSVLTFFSDPQLLLRYLAPRTSGIVNTEKGEEGPIGRIDRIAAALQYLSRDPVQLMVGLGLGQVTTSPIEALSADMDALSEDIGIETGETLGWQTQASSGAAVAHILWETGLVGVLLLFVFLYFVFRDAKALSRREGIDGAIGLAWCAIVPIIAISYFYKDILPVNGIMYPFWYLTGYVIAQRFRHDHQTASVVGDLPVQRRPARFSPTPAPPRDPAPDQPTPAFRSLAPRLRNSRP